METNRAMRQLLDSIGSLEKVEIPELLAGIIQGSFIAEEGCTFLDTLYRLRGNATRLKFNDEVGYECYVNHIHIDDFLSENLLETGLISMRYVESRWKKQKFEGNLRIILSFENDNCILRFHKVRNQQNWLTPDLDLYNEAILTQISVGD